MAVGRLVVWTTAVAGARLAPAHRCSVMAGRARPLASEPPDDVPRIAPKGPTGPDVPPQLARSRALVNEGLEGLPSRAGALLQLGATFWLGLPVLFAVPVVVLAVALLYANLGTRFIHGGRPAGMAPSIVRIQDVEEADEGLASSRVPFERVSETVVTMPPSR